MGSSIRLMLAKTGDDSASTRDRSPTIAIRNIDDSGIDYLSIARTIKEEHVTGIAVGYDRHRHLFRRVVGDARVIRGRKATAGDSRLIMQSVTTVVIITGVVI